MKSINPKNCEACFLDYYEGNLDELQVAELHAFLNAHPHWKSVFEEYGQIADDEVSASSAETAFHSSAQLKQHDLDDDLIALMEGDLTPVDVIQLQAQIAGSAELTADFELLLQTKLYPDLSVVFPDKRKLKKSAPIVPVLFRYSAVAAMLGTAFISAWMFNQSQENLPVVAENHSVATTETMAPTLQENASAVEAESGALVKPEPSGNLLQPEITPLENSESTHRKDDKEDNGVEPVSEPVHTNGQNLFADLEKIPVRGTIEPLDVKTEVTIKDIPVTKPYLPEFTDADLELAEAHTKKGIVGTLLSAVGEHVADKIKNISEDKLLIEQNVNQDDEVYTSTFKLGVFEVYRSRTIK